MVQKSVEIGENKQKAAPVRQTSRMSDNPKYELRVGLFAAGAIGLVLGGMGWLKGFSFHPPQRFIVEFHDVAGLNNNAPVNINGVRVGVVEKIELSKTAAAAAAQPAAPTNPNMKTEPGIVYVHLKISTEETTIPQGSAITIQTQGMVGAKYIEITLPELAVGQKLPPDIQPDSVVVGQDPVRIELMMNKIATKLNGIVNAAGSEGVGPSLADALKHSGEAVSNINEAAKKLNKNMDRMEKASDTFTTTATKIGSVADSAKGAANNASSFFARGNKTMDSVDTLATGFQTTSKKLNRILDNPGFSGDLRETARLAKATADSIAATMDKVNATIADPSVRGDVKNMLDKISVALDKTNASLKTVDKLSQDKELRDVIVRASDTLGKFNKVLDSQGLTGDVKTTSAKLREASDNVNIAAEQIQQVLNKPSFGMGLLIGKSGKLKKKPAEAEATVKASKAAESKAKDDLQKDRQDVRNGEQEKNQSAPSPETKN
jgi:ABC-type transporter Mla subunit MlaD